MRALKMVTKKKSIARRFADGQALAERLENLKDGANLLVTQDEVYDMIVFFGFATPSSKMQEIIDQDAIKKKPADGFVWYSGTQILQYLKNSRPRSGATPPPENGPRWDRDSFNRRGAGPVFKDRQGQGPYGRIFHREALGRPRQAQVGPHQQAD